MKLKLPPNTRRKYSNLLKLRFANFKPYKLIFAKKFAKFENHMTQKQRSLPTRKLKMKVSFDGLVGQLLATKMASSTTFFKMERPMPKQRPTLLTLALMASATASWTKIGNAILV